MANPGYVRSSDGDNADDGSTWALANATLAGAMTDQSAGDRIWVSDNHAESTAAAVTITTPGTIGSPCQILCGDDAAEPPTALATSGTVATTGNNGITIAGYSYWYGIGFSAGGGGSGGASITLLNNNGMQTYESCDFTIANTQNSTNSAIVAGGAANNQEVHFINCRFKFSGASQGIKGNGGMVHIVGGSVISGGTNITNAFLPPLNAGRNFSLLVDGFDFSNWAASLNLVSGGSQNEMHCIFRNCKLPASWSGSLFSAAPTLPRMRAEMYNCSASDTNYALWVEDYAGSTKHETTIVRTGGASDGDTTLSWKMATSANAEYPHMALRSPEIFSSRITSVGSSKTITVEFVHDSVTALQDDEIWLEVQYLGTSGVPLALFVDDAAADILATPADQTSSSETWTTTGLTNPNKQKLSVSFTPQEEGVAICTVCLAKASYTVYVDPLATVS